MSLSGHQSARAKNYEWITPPEILAPLGAFDLDPCAPEFPPYQIAKRRYWKDGLELPWEGRVFCNPPFGNQAIHWMRKMRDHGNGIALLPARTETKMFYETVWGHADTVLFIKGRPHFHFVDGRRASFNSGAPICLISYDKQSSSYLRTSGLGFCVSAKGI